VFTYAVKPQLNDFASSVFETVCREFIRKKNRRGELSFRIASLGRWWGKLNQTTLTDIGKEKIVAVAEREDNFFFGGYFDF
jgi:hypothetical protein